jgi:hypothetical protein
MAKMAGPDLVSFGHGISSAGPVTTDSFPHGKGHMCSLRAQRAIKRAKSIHKRLQKRFLVTQPLAATHQLFFFLSDEMISLTNAGALEYSLISATAFAEQKDATYNMHLL